MILSSNNPYYKFSFLKKISNPTKYLNKVTTFYVLKGKLSLLIEKEKIEIKETEGIVLSPNLKVDQIHSHDGSEILEVVSDKKNVNLIENIDNGNQLEENLIEKYKILKNHKKVEKPWGYELWLIWLKEYHVLKKIYMKKGFKCSLQFHEKKYETNFLTSGRAKILKNFHIDKYSSDVQAQELIKDIDLIKEFSQDVDAPFNFTNVPGEVHRVFSLEDYTAYEVSTPELDDVIRIQDDSKRKSGRVLSEHNNK